MTVSRENPPPRSPPLLAFSAGIDSNNQDFYLKGGVTRAGDRSDPSVWLSVF